MIFYVSPITPKSLLTFIQSFGLPQSNVVKSFEVKFAVKYERHQQFK